MNRERKRKYECQKVVNQIKEKCMGMSLKQTHLRMINQTTIERDVEPVQAQSYTPPLVRESWSSASKTPHETTYKRDVIEIDVEPVQNQNYTPPLVRESGPSENQHEAANKFDDKPAQKRKRSSSPLHMYNATNNQGDPNDPVATTSSMLCRKNKDDILRKELAAVVATRGLTREVTEILLAMLTRYGVKDLPKTRQALLGPVSKPEIYPAGNGRYLHIGVQKAIEMQLKDVPKSEIPTVIRIDSSVDGVSPYGSSIKSMWPILGDLLDFESRPFLIGAFWGDGHPSSPEVLMERFIKEIIFLTENGITIRKNIKRQFQLRFVHCDTPAKAMLKGTRGHLSYFPCHNCDYKCDKLDRSMLHSSVRGNPRTNEMFRNRDQVLHHTENYAQPGSTVFEAISTFDMIKGFPIDPMHLVDLGVVKMLLDYIPFSKRIRMGTKKKGKLDEYDDCDADMLSQAENALRQNDSTESLLDATEDESHEEKVDNKAIYSMLRTVTRDLSVLNITCGDILGRTLQIQREVDVLVNERETTRHMLFGIPEKFPVETEDELNILLANIAKSPSKYLQRFKMCKCDTYNYATSGLGAILGSELMHAYNYDGLRNKQSFKIILKPLDEILKAAWNDDKTDEEHAKDMRAQFQRAHVRFNTSKSRAKKRTESHETSSASSAPPQPSSSKSTAGSDLTESN
ncbi:hypothetical protein DMENIID0001_121560 [Sergentomyia squamirostris]